MFILDFKSVELGMGLFGCVEELKEASLEPLSKRLERESFLELT